MDFVRGDWDLDLDLSVNSEIIDTEKLPGTILQTMTIGFL